jgi:Tfp pilus assembly protein PilV
MKLSLSSHRGAEGLTLIELVVAVLILTFGVVGALTVLVQAQTSTNGTTAKELALNAAQENMELVFVSAPASTRSNFNNVTFPVGDLVGAAGGDPGLITVVADPVLTDLLTVTITVSWQGMGNRHAGQVTLVALRSEATR